MLSDHFADKVSFLDPGQFVVKSTIKIGHQIVVATHQTQDRGVQVSDVPTVHDRFCPEFIGLTVGGTTSNTSAG